jgi:hypothetical protein
MCILELDELGYHLLSLVDGKRSIADFNRLLGGGSRKKLIDAFEELARVGVMECGGLAPLCSRSSVNNNKAATGRRTPK